MAMLSEQYRMHPAISAWPASYFYHGNLVDGPSVKGGGCAAAFHAHACFPPLALFDCRFAPAFHLSYPDPPSTPSKSPSV